MTKFVEVNGAKYAYEDDGKGPVIVFGHSLAFNRRQFEAQAEFLSKDFRCIRLDFPGQGLSVGKQGGWDVWDMVEDLRAFLNAIGVSKAILVGISQGAAVFGRFVGRYPEMVEAFVLMSANPTAFPPAARERVSAQADILAKGDKAQIDEMLAALIQRNLSDYTLAHKPEVIERARAIVFGHNLEGLSQAQRVPLSYDALGDHLKATSFPVMVMWGRGDKTLPPENAETYRALLPSSRIEIVDNGGHALPMEQAEEVSGLIGNFIQSFKRV